MNLLEEVLLWVEAYKKYEIIYFPFDHLRCLRKLEREGLVVILEIEKPFLIKVRFNL